MIFEGNRMSKARTDIDGLEKEARSSEHDESYQTVERNEHFRIGTGVRTSKEEATFFMEVVIQLCCETRKVDTENLSRKVESLKKLKGSGYRLKCEEDSTISCEKEINKDGLEEELELVENELGPILNRGGM